MNPVNVHADAAEPLRQLRDVPDGSSGSATSNRPILARRIDALDMSKGVLVVFMVIYHSLNYTTQYQLAFRYMAFLPPSFIVITGFLLSHVYLARPGVTFAQLSARLLTRGTKLLALFTLLNVAAQFLRSRNYHGRALGPGEFFAHWMDIYVYGESRLAVFEILLPISYLLILAPVLLWATMRQRWFLPIFTVLAVSACVLLEQIVSPHVFMMAAGLVGMLAGRVSTETLKRLGQHVLLLGGTYALYAGASAAFGAAFVLQLVGALIALALVYGICVAIDNGGWTQRRLASLGRYSLFAYIFQIATLQLYSHVAGRPEPVSMAALLMLSVTLVLTAVVTECLAWASARSRVVGGLYRAVMP